MSDPLSKRRLKMWIRLLGVTRAAESHLREFLRVQHDTTLPRFDVLAALYRRREGVTMSELSRMLLVSNGNATTVVDRLENDGLVRRTPSETDRRTVFVALTPEGRAKLTVGTFSHGQGHETAFAQILSEKLGLPFDAIDLIQGDSDVVVKGGGTGGSRSSQMGGVATSRAATMVIEKAKRIAAHLLEAGVADIEFLNSRFSVAGTDIATSWPAVIAAAHDPARLPPNETPGLDEQLTYTRDTECNFPNGCHVAEVEVDPTTGEVTIANYAAVDDVGVPINPMLVHGQCHGGIMAGIGQAMLEHAQYDPESGQFLTATFQDYCMPRAGDAPSFTLDLNVVPCPSNDLGVKGAGEGGACGAPPAIISAVCDALGVAHVDMPITPESIWRIVQGKQAA